MKDRAVFALAVVLLWSGWACVPMLEAGLPASRPFAEAALELLFLATSLRYLTSYGRFRREAMVAIQRLGWNPEGDRSAWAGRLRPKAPRGPPSGCASAAPELHRQIEVAAAASVECGKTLGVIHFNVARRLPPGAGVGECMEQLQAAFRRVLRKTDNVAAISETEIVICVSLLPGLPELKRIAARLHACSEAMGPAGAVLGPAGLAIYPLCGYQGEDLIEFARHRRAATPGLTDGAGSGLQEPQNSIGRLGLCERPVKRLVRAYRQRGDAGPVSRQRGRASNHRPADGLFDRIAAL